VPGTMYRAVAAERDQMAGLLPSCLRAFSALPDFLSSIQHFLNVPSVAVQRTLPGRACFAPQKPGRGRCRIRFRPRNLLRIYLVPFCVGYSQSRLEPNVIEPRLLFDPLVDCVFFLDRSWTGNANEQPISPPADGRHVPLGRGRCKHYRNIGRSCAVIIGSRFLDKGLVYIGRVIWSRPEAAVDRH
jgi:hypothetical protein